MTDIDPIELAITRTIKQGKRCVDNTGTCVYWDKSTGLKCAAGQILPESEWVPELESLIVGEEGLIDDVFKRLYPDMSIRHLAIVQQAHDHSYSGKEFLPAFFNRISQAIDSGYLPEKYLKCLKIPEE